MIPVMQKDINDCVQISWSPKKPIKGVLSNECKTFNSKQTMKDNNAFICIKLIVICFIIASRQS